MEVYFQNSRQANLTCIPIYLKNLRHILPVILINQVSSKLKATINQSITLFKIQLKSNSFKAAQ